MFDRIEIVEKTPEAEQERVLRLGVGLDEAGDFVVYGCDKEGSFNSRQPIIYITKRGNAILAPSCRASGIKVDEEGHIQVRQC